MKEFRNFIKMLDDLGPKDFQYHGTSEHQVILRKPNINVGMCLTKSQVQELIEMGGEAILFQELFSLVA
ncbi:MAG: hypothetical protein KI790_11310 [Cyclobacteriaceae bacterium]|nr:hypothetical protein [Cyclobacteriaceae bacterium HetDA_MAG_MS6]